MSRPARAGRTTDTSTTPTTSPTTSTDGTRRLLAGVTAAALLLVLVDALRPLGAPLVVGAAAVLSALAALALLRRAPRGAAAPLDASTARTAHVAEGAGSAGSAHVAEGGGGGDAVEAEAVPDGAPVVRATPMTTRDELTGLADRAALTCALSAALTPGEGPCADAFPADDLSLVALLLVDLDAFRELNDRFGHGAGDVLLRRTADRIAACAPESALVARLGGDEFAVLLRGSEAAQARRVADELAAAISAPAPEDGAGWRTTASIGLAFDDGPLDDDEELWVDPAQPGDGAAEGDLADGLDELPDVPAAPADAREVELTPAEDLLRRVEVAMYSAKATGGGVRLYDPAHDLAARERALLAEELRAALSEGGELDRSATAQLVVHYQPQVEASTGEVGGLEALVRWRHPRHGLVSPEVFLEIVEEQGLVTSLTERVLRTALLDARQWHDAGHRVRIAVNVSSSCLTSPALLPMVDAALEESGVEPSLLVVEVTETVLMAEPHQALATARRLRARGVQLSIDDYGTGYSSLSYLSDLPATELKLDRAFTLRVASDPAIEAIVATTVDLAHRLGLRLVVEGVEDEVALAAVVAAGADETQGYLHARPAPAASVPAWLAGRDLRSSPSSSAVTPVTPVTPGADRVEALVSEA
ncbi:bifunctional diguanylate cyclase/phosphodiesterase [Quadrisphaera sp. INWT6]|uniref:putative bifunctional diguanylate cyclase/phosphodiesterase n=1 Tax=Quadrisphaera sp. INWT6 TaxID=2596917 RepID=UPI001891F3F1|nr:bifunctional diguanylate cyclase/phosphodiesterase [Quadrisphaera sp. INWT6]MBF5082486.1 bifunctional diguanylate cyclase/phosphodiesterase [Quadrisphaera sp. INWT6]